MALKTNSNRLIAATLALLVPAVLSAQYKVIVPGAGNTSAFISENTTPSQGTCYQLNTPFSGAGVFLGGKICAKMLDGGSDVNTNSIFFELPCDLNTCLLDIAFIRANLLQFRQWATISANVNGAAMLGSNAYLDFNSPSTIRAANTQSALFGAAAIFVNSGVGDHSIIFARYNNATVADQPISMTESMQIDTNGNLIPGADNTYTNGAQAKLWSNFYTANATFGRPNSVQGAAAFYNPTNSSFFEMAGTNAATGGGDLAIGNFIGPDAIYPINSSVDLGFNGSRFRKIWVRDIDISGICTGCSAGVGANTSLSNLTATSINAPLLFDTDNSYNIGTNTKELGSIFTVDMIVGNNIHSGSILLYNGVTNSPNFMAGSNMTGNSDIQIGPLFQTGWAVYPVSTNVGDLGTSGNHWRTLYINNINASGSLGLSTTVVVPCGTLTYTDGVLTNKGTC